MARSWEPTTQRSRQWHLEIARELNCHDETATRILTEDYLKRAYSGLPEAGIKVWTSSKAGKWLEPSWQRGVQSTARPHQDRAQSFDIESSTEKWTENTADLAWKQRNAWGGSQRDRSGLQNQTQTDQGLAEAEDGPTNILNSSKDFGRTLSSLQTAERRHKELTRWKLSSCDRVPRYVD